MSKYVRIKFEEKEYYLIPSEGKFFDNFETFKAYIDLKEAERALIEELIATHPYKSPKLTRQELFEIFPEGRQMTIRIWQIILKQKESQIKDLIEEEQEIMKSILKHRRKEDKEFLNIVKEHCIANRKKLQKEYAGLRYRIYLMKNEQTSEKAAGSSRETTEAHIMQAKEIPITTLYGEQTRRSGQRLYGLCPFHGEKQASFCIYEDQNKWWCFSCNSGGDIIDFVMKRDSIDFISAVKKLTNV